MAAWSWLGAILILAAPASAGEVGESVRFAGRPVVHSAMVQPSGSGKVIFDTGESDAPGEAYDTILMQGFMPDEGVRLELSIASLAGWWHTWTAAEVKRFPSGRFWARYKAPSPGRSPVRLRAVDAGIRAAHTFELYDLELFLAGVPEAGAPPAQGQARPSAGAYPFVKRADWGAKPPKSDYTAHDPVRFTMHHTAGRKPAGAAEEVEEMRFLQDFHQNGRGWIDIGYHFVISPSGRVFEGRPEGVLGAHVLNRNTGNVGASFMGNYHPPVSDEPTAEALDAFVALGRRLAADYKIPGPEIRGHRDFPQQTDCPGDILYARLAGLKDRILAPALRPGVTSSRLPRTDFAADAYLKSLSW